MTDKQYSKESKPRPSVSGTSGSATSRALQLILAFPVLLAIYALVLQFHSGSVTTLPSHIHLHANVAREREHYTKLPSAQQGGDTSTTGSGSTKTGQGTIASMPWQPLGVDSDGPKVAFCVTTSESPQQIKHWIGYHKLVGVGYYYLFVDGAANTPAVIAELRAIPGVKVVPRDEKIKARQAKSRIWDETWLSAFFHKPCNHELFVLQSLNMESAYVTTLNKVTQTRGFAVAIEMAANDGMDWILHIDTDELMYPAGPGDFSLQRLLAAQPKNVDTIVFPNYESLPESENVENPFLEVTLFKKNYDHVVSDLYFKNYHTVAHNNPNYFITYGNGKSAARLKSGLRSNGAHRFHNYFSHPKEVTAQEAAVLHYTYNRFRELKSRRDRCDCAPTEKDAERCFILPFDRQAFLAASLKSDKELHQWFKDRLLWDDQEVVADMIKKGLFMRTNVPQVVIKGIIAAEEAESSGDMAGRTKATSGREEAVAAQAQPEPLDVLPEEQPDVVVPKSQRKHRIHTQAEADAAQQAAAEQQPDGKSQEGN